MNPIAPELATTPPTTASASPLELVCPAGSLPALKTAIDHGADCVYLGFRDATNARNFAGLNFDEKAIAQGIEYAHSRARKVLVAYMAQHYLPGERVRIEERGGRLALVDYERREVIPADVIEAQWRLTGPTE